MNKHLINPAYRAKTWTGFPLMGLCLVLVSACSTTQKVAVNQSDVNCVFLANDCSMLTAGGKGRLTYDTSIRLRSGPSTIKFCLIR